jgi:hypothetical protein
VKSVVRKSLTLFSSFCILIEKSYFFIGMGHEHFWTSGTDQGEEGKFFWMGTGKPVTYQNWNAGEPNNFQ